MDRSTPTLRVALPTNPLLEAVIIEVPEPTAVATPEELIEATEVLDEAHVMTLDRAPCEPSEYIPLAVYD